MNLKAHVEVIYSRRILRQADTDIHIRDHWWTSQETAQKSDKHDQQWGGGAWTLLDPYLSKA